MSTALLGDQTPFPGLGKKPLPSQVGACRCSVDKYLPGRRLNTIQLTLISPRSPYQLFKHAAHFLHAPSSGRMFTQSRNCVSPSVGTLRQLRDASHLVQRRGGGSWHLLALLQGCSPVFRVLCSCSPNGYSGKGTRSPSALQPLVNKSAREMGLYFLIY